MDISHFIHQLMDIWFIPFNYSEKSCYEHSCASFLCGHMFLVPGSGIAGSYGSSLFSVEEQLYHWSFLPAVFESHIHTSHNIKVTILKCTAQCPSVHLPVMWPSPVSNHFMPEKKKPGKQSLPASIVILIRAILEVWCGISPWFWFQSLMTSHDSCLLDSAEL